MLAYRLSGRPGYRVDLGHGPVCHDVDQKGEERVRILTFVPVYCCRALRNTHHILDVKIAFLARHACAVGDGVAVDGVGLLLGEAEGGLEGGQVAGGKHLRRGLEDRLGQIGRR